MLTTPFDRLLTSCYSRNAGWSSLVARWAHNPKVGGSNPPPATNPLNNLAMARSDREWLIVSELCAFSDFLRASVNRLHRQIAGQGQKNSLVSLCRKKRLSALLAANRC